MCLEFHAGSKPEEGRQSPQKTRLEVGGGSSEFGKVPRVFTSSEPEGRRHQISALRNRPSPGPSSTGPPGGHSCLYYVRLPLPLTRRDDLYFSPLGIRRRVVGERVPPFRSQISGFTGICSSIISPSVTPVVPRNKRSTE